MGKVIACIDGSTHADSVCSVSAWIAEHGKLDVSLLHVVPPHSDFSVKGNLSGSIGLGAKSGLLKELTNMDEARGKLEQKKGQLMLEHAKDELAAKNILQVETLHRRGSLVETITELEPEADIIVMGKRGENAESAPGHLGSNLERVARATQKPLLVTTKHMPSITRFLIAYDGSPTAQKAIEYAANNPLLKTLECHLLHVSDTTSETEAMLNAAKDTLTEAGFTVHASIQSGKSVEDIVSKYVDTHDIGLLVIGAYGHSKIRSLILGSTTTALIQRTKVPVLLFR